MVQIVLIRPGSTDFDQQGRILGTLDLPLNERGNSDVEQTIAELRPLGIEAIYSSECLPAVQSAERIGEALGIKVKQLPRMQNLEYGLWQGMLVDEVRRKQPKVYRQWQEQPECVRPPQGETLLEAAERVHSSLTTLLKKHKRGTIGIVLPEPLASLARRQLAGGELANLWRPRAEAEHCEIIEVTPHSLVPSS